MLPNTRNAIMKAVRQQLMQGFTREQVFAALARRWNCTATEVKAIAAFKQRPERAIRSPQAILAAKTYKSHASVIRPVYEPVGEEYERRKAEARQMGIGKARQARINAVPRVEVQVVKYCETFGRQRF